MCGAILGAIFDCIYPDDVIGKDFFIFFQIKLNFLKDLIFQQTQISIFLNIEKWQVYVVCKHSLLKLLQDFEEKNVLRYVINSVEAH